MIERDLPTVLEKMIGEIPIETDNKSFVDELMDVRNSALYSSPEMMYLWWCEGSQVLESHLPDPNNLNEWQQKVVNIWMNQNV